MNWHEMAGQWTQMKGEVKRKWGRLTDDDLAVFSGSHDKLIGRIQERYGLAKENAERQFDDWCKTAQLPHDPAHRKTL
jgi:uncharacterized protein YjbJ (UPF0337 family)